MAAFFFFFTVFFLTHHSLYNTSKDDVFVVQPRRGLEGDEELRAVSIRTRVRHGHQAGNCVLELEVLVGELCAVDAATWMNIKNE